MKTMIKKYPDSTYTRLNIVEHIIIENFWEYYLIEKDIEHGETDDYRMALVMGDAIEVGGVSMDEISPYILSRTTNLSEVMPAEGWDWEN